MDEGASRSPLTLCATFPRETMACVANPNPKHSASTQGPPSFRNTARRRLDAATPPGEAPGNHQRVGFCDVSDRICDVRVKREHQQARLPPSREIGSVNLWPKRVLKTQNVMEWRSFFNTTNANNVTHGNYLTTHKADLGDHDGRKKSERAFNMPFGKKYRDVEPDHDMGIYKPSKRCYEELPRRKLKVDKNSIVPITLAQAMGESSKRRADTLSRLGISEGIQLHGTDKEWTTQRKPALLRGESSKSSILGPLGPATMPGNFSGCAGPGAYAGAAQPYEGYGQTHKNPPKRFTHMDR